MKRLARWSVVRFVTDNLGWMGISILLALIIWVVAQLDANPIQQREFAESITIQFIENNNDNVVLLTSSTLRRTARVTIRAPRHSWDQLERNDIEVYADLTELGVGTHTVNLYGEITENGPSGRVVSVSPANILVEIVALEKLTLPINITPFSELSAEYETALPVCDAQEVEVSGPEVLVEQVSGAQVRLSIRRANPPFTHIGRVILFDDEGNELSSRDLDSLTVTPSQVTCEIEVVRVEGTQELLVAPVITGSPPQGYTISNRSWDPLKVVVAGDPILIESLRGVAQTEPISTEGATSSFSRTVQVELPDGVQVRPETTRVTVTVEITPITTTEQFTDVPIQLLNLNPALLVSSVVPQTVSVTIAGPAPLIRDLTVEDISVIVDLTGLREGTHTDLVTHGSILQEAVAGTATITVQPNVISVVLGQIATPTPTPHHHIIG